MVTCQWVGYLIQRLLRLVVRQLLATGGAVGHDHDVFVEVGDRVRHHKDDGVQDQERATFTCTTDSVY